MLDKAILLLFLHLVLCSISSPLYPALRYSPGPVAGKAMSFQLQHSSSLQSQNPLAEEQEEEGFLSDSTEKRFVPRLPALLLQGVLVAVSPQPRSSSVSPKPSPMSRAMSCCPHQQGHTDGAGSGLLQGTEFSTELWGSAGMLEPLLSISAWSQRILISA
uniref:Uncharacterized protein n=1 Tax=Taeniopygia guttata TaxID=59729 RepID=A0A674GIA9_TAEGU